MSPCSRYRSRFPGLVLAGAVAASCVAGTSKDSPITGHTAADEGDVTSDRFVERVFYPVREGTADPEQNWADFYLPDRDMEPDTVPLVMLLHSGAWHSGAGGSRRMAEALTQRGLAVYNVE